MNDLENLKILKNSFIILFLLPFLKKYNKINFLNHLIYYILIIFI